ncbi:hypothetical protein [Qipengyuania sp. JC766]|uniref:hypothetical protein n=1 Tax=Qipengyuania sp. JC766 TaxID=3232139 RepID=UPI003457A8BB
MTQQSDPPSDNSRWTGPKAMAFLHALAQHGKVAAAARGVGMSRQAAYRLRARAPEFARIWHVALQEAATRRAAARKRKARVHPLLAKGPRTGDTPAGRVTGGPLTGHGRGAAR